MTSTRWDWIRQNPRGGIDASALSKLFRNRSDNMGPEDLLAREAIQNSADASKEYRNKGIPFAMRFRFVEYSGDDAKAHSAAFGLEELRERLNGTAWPEATRPVQAPCLEKSETVLRVLYIEDYGAHGLRGPLGWSSYSDLFNAIYMVGASNKRPDAGGSFGFGKSAIFNAGELRSVYAYSCFKKGYVVEVPGQDSLADECSRRAVGFLYWRAHRDGAIDYDGRAELAQSPELPFEDERADQIAHGWGISRRDTENPAEHGTTFAVVAPRVTPEALLSAIELYWWPAIVDSDMALDVEIIKADGSVLRPDVKSRADLNSYIKAFEVARVGTSRQEDPDELIKTAAEEAELNSQGPWQVPTGKRPGGIQPGQFGVVLPAAAESGEVDPYPRVARIRSTRMVIDYWRLERARINLPLRATYVASSEEDPLLRKTEDAGHAGWAERGDPPPEPYELAAGISKGIREALRDVSEAAMPKTDDKELEANELAAMLKLPGRDRSGLPEKVPPKLQIAKLKAARSAESTGSTYRIIGSFTVQAVAEQAYNQTTRVEIGLSARYASESVDPETLPFILSVPENVKALVNRDGSIELTLKRGVPCEVGYEIPRLLVSRSYGVKIQPTARLAMIKKVSR
jgi:hypothetical protein